jgi:predicted nucleotide-binding protein
MEHWTYHKRAVSSRHAAARRARQLALGLGDATLALALADGFRAIDQLLAAWVVWDGVADVRAMLAPEVNAELERVGTAISDILYESPDRLRLLEDVAVIGDAAMAYTDAAIGVTDDDGVQILYRALFTRPEQPELVDMREAREDLEFMAWQARRVRQTLAVGDAAKEPQEAEGSTKTDLRRDSPTRIFIGHGHSREWYALKDFLTMQLHLDVEHFEAESTAGVLTVDRLQQMLETCTFAFIVLTAEDEAGDGSMRARQNAVHEVGLFQGHLGFGRAIPVLEDGCAEFSNIAGLGQLRFGKGKIEDAYEGVRRALAKAGISTPG